MRLLSKSNGVKIGFTHRDLRDAAVSIQIKFKVKNEELYRRLDNAVDIHGFVAAMPAERRLIQEYDEMRAQLPRVIERHARFLNLDVTPGTIVNLANELGIKGGLSIYRMAFLPAILRKLINRALGAGRFDRTTLWHPDHISRNRGKSGIWRDQLDPEIVATIERRYQAYINEYDHLSPDATSSGRR